MKSNVNFIKSNCGLQQKGKKVPIIKEEVDSIIEKSYEIFDYDILESMWYNIRIEGKLPESRSNHTSFLYNNKFYD